MSETTKTPASTPATPAATPASATTQKATEPDKKSITLTFEGDDLAIHTKIVKQAAEEDRTPSIELLRFVRKHFGKVVSS